MGRQTINMQNGDTMVIGYDKPFDTWFAYMRKSGSRHEADVVIGYHPAEQQIAKSENPGIVIGPYPVHDVEVLLKELIPEWFGTDPERVEAYKPLENQDMCWYCKKPPWQPSPGCGAHPYERLHR